jgi:1-aminocyclopropane-1-carboxylate deaminase/D-cysteine desulfhydrase-like pyridoxal-dependent ACC family enzyme
MNPPIIVEHRGIRVARDDLLPGGTKTRYMPFVFKGTEEVVYASPCEGGAQTALAHSARELGKRATIFVARRSTPHPRSVMAKRLGARVFQVPNGYLNVVKARAREYCRRTGATLAPFGFNFPEGIRAIAEAAKAAEIQPDEVWCASGSGVLATALSVAFPYAKRHVVEVGRSLTAQEVAGATIHKAVVKFSKECKSKPPFPSDPHYDAKAWEICIKNHGAGTILFWNVTGPAA